MGEQFAAGDLCLLLDAKGRRYLIRLTEGGEFHSHRGVIRHGDLIGSEQGTIVAPTGGGSMVAVRPRLTDYILKMPRGAQVVYPKDIGPILMWADVAPGARVVEAGTGSGALTMALVRAVGPAGCVVSVERRSDHAAFARRTIERWFGEIPANLDLRVGDVEDVIREVEPDRLILDVPEPWHAAEVAAEFMAPGAVLCAYVPTVPQLQQIVETLRATGCFDDITSFESLLRTWNVKGRSVRPDHRMVGHTGFVTVARKVAAPGS